VEGASGHIEQEESAAKQFFELATILCVGNVKWRGTTLAFLSTMLTIITSLSL
jgi:hypothetical protein